MTAEDEKYMCDLMESTKTIPWCFETEVNYVHGDGQVHKVTTYWLKHPYASCRALLRETWEPPV